MDVSTSLTGTLGNVVLDSLPSHDTALAVVERHGTIAHSIDQYLSHSMLLLQVN